jgi:hypothetical protein
MHLASRTSSPKDGAILSAARPCSSFEVVASKVIYRLFGLILHVCGNGQWWAHRIVAPIPRFPKSRCVCNYTQSGWDSLTSHKSKPCGNNSEVLGIEWAVPGLYTGCPTWASQSSTNLAIAHWTKWLWLPRKWSPPAFRSGTNESPTWPGEPPRHHDFDDIPDYRMSWKPYKAVYGGKWCPTITWWRWTIIIWAV